MVHALGVHVATLPEVRESHEVVGPLLQRAAAALGVPEGVPVLNGMYDGAAVACGLGVTSPGVAVLNVGTTAMLRCIVATPVFDRAVTPRFQTYRLSAERWFAGGGVNNAGSVTAWYAAAVARAPLPRLEREATRVPPGCDGLRCIPTLVPERTGDSGTAAGVCFTGVRSLHGRAHFYRSILEGTAFLVCRIAEGMRCAGLPMNEVRAAGRGTSSILWMRILAAMLEVPIGVSRMVHMGLTGCAHVGVRTLFPGFEHRQPLVARRYVLDPSLNGRYREIRAEYEALLDRR